MAGYLGSNISRNVQIPHGVRLMFLESGTTSWINLGDLSDVSVTPLAEFLEAFSNHDGKNALVKRILTNRGISIECTLNEINVENLKLVFMGGATGTQSKTIQVAEVVTGSINTGNPNSEVDYTLSDTPTGTVTVKSESGATTYTATTDYTISGVTITAETTGSINVDGNKIHVSYGTNIGSSTKFEVLGNTEIEGQAQFQIRNQDGGLSQILELSSVTIAPTGAIATPVDAIQTLPLTLTAQAVNGSFGDMFLVDV
jgi:hypothetical protein